ncbi:prolyl oligopeptidase family serine peptidase [Mesorhizobium sp. M0698]|uniref:prolyl oligopeptidase family serine peptidase n=1 Tax=Mesorhizobium sp. M0698 TaxID=2956987 RepID=UPI0033353519
MRNITRPTERSSFRLRTRSRKLLLLDLNAAAPLGAPVILKRNPENFDASGLVVTRHEAVSTGGEVIPYTQVGPANGNGDAPFHLTAYGGYGISLLPHYNSSLGKLWLERGGTCVVANIRGGGEFGTRWHEAGRNVPISGYRRLRARRE